MANKKISTITADGSPSLDDVVVTVDLGSGLNKKVTLADLADLFHQDVVNAYCFRAYASGSTTLTDGTWTSINFATEEYDYSGNFASNVYTAPISGVYHFDACVTHATASASVVFALTAIWVNGVERIDGNGNPASTTGVNRYHVSGDIYLAAGEGAYVAHYQDSGGNEATATQNYSTWFSGHLVHAV